MSKKTKIKICGLTKPFEAEYLIQNQVDYAGMVLFFEKSRRNITIAQAKEIMKRLGNRIGKVAVTVSPTLSQVQQIEKAGFDIIQIHGDVCTDIWEQTEIPIWKAFNVEDLSQFSAYQENPRVKGYVFDAARPGSGEIFDWKLLDKIPKDEKLHFLAGGLTPENVGAAIRYLSPDGVDVSSAVEYENRQEKDRQKIDAFVAEVRRTQERNLD